MFYNNDDPYNQLCNCAYLCGSEGLRYSSQHSMALYFVSNESYSHKAIFHSMGYIQKVKLGIWKCKTDFYRYRQPVLHSSPDETYHNFQNNRHVLSRKTNKLMFLYTFAVSLYVFICFL